MLEILNIVYIHNIIVTLMLIFILRYIMCQCMTLCLIVHVGVCINFVYEIEVETVF